MNYSSNLLKPISDGNLISPNVFCADPTAVEYEGRLYVYGTNDHQQFLNAEKNTYEKIKTLVCFSTDDMVNWTFHGEINVEKIMPWVYNAWAPSICKRVEDDGKTHFYMYFSNTGCGVGVLTATSPTGPWSTPLKEGTVGIVYQNMPGLDTPAPFDPGVCIDDNGVGWLAFGGGVCEGKTRTMPGSSKLIKLGADMISVDSDFIDLQAPHFFEASEMNYINGTYVYTFNADWENRDDWPLEGTDPSTRCSMCYMTSKTPLDSSSWKYQKHYFKNPGDMGYGDSNNHTHFEKFMGKWYLFYHTLSLEEKMEHKGGFRSLCVTPLEVDETAVEIKMANADRKGTDPLKNLNPYSKVNGTTVYTSADMWYENIDDPKNIASCAQKDGAWMMVKNVDFATGTEEFSVNVKGTGFVEVHLDSLENNAVAVLQVGNANEYSQVTASLVKKLSGIHDVYFVFATKGTCLKDWNC